MADRNHVGSSLDTTDGELDGDKDLDGCSDAKADGVSEETADG